MQSWRYLRLCGLASLVFALAADLARADAPPDPLRLVTAQADFVIQVPRPRRLVESAVRSEWLRELRRLDAVAEQYDSTNARRFFQLVTYFEKQLDTAWPDLLDRVAGGGIALASKFGGQPAPVVFVVQGTDAELVRRLFRLGLDVIVQEQARLETKNARQDGTHRGVATVSVGKEFHAAVVGAAIVISNKDSGLKSAIDLHLDGPAKSLASAAPVAARKLLPDDPLAWLWLNLEPAHKSPQGKEFFSTPNQFFPLTVVFGGLVDVARRAPFVCAGLFQQGDGLLARVRMPAGRDGMTEVVTAHAPPPGKAGPLPLLEPRGVLYSSSYYLDLSKFWEYRKQLLDPKSAKSFEEFDKNSGRFLVGHRFSKLLQHAGAYQRVVVANQHAAGYKTQPGQRIPSFAVVLSPPEPEAFGKEMESVLRAAAFLVSTQVKLKLVEEKHAGQPIVGYRFAEDAPLKGDEQYVRFNYSPCFARVGSQFVASSTLELCRELIDLLQKENGQTPATAAAVRTKLYAAGAAEALQLAEDQLYVQAILNQALAADQAREQVQLLIRLVRQLGSLRLETAYGANDFRFDIQLSPQRHKGNTEKTSKAGK